MISVSKLFKLTNVNADGSTGKIFDWNDADDKYQIRLSMNLRRLQSYQEMKWAGEFLTAHSCKFNWLWWLINMSALGTAYCAVYTPLTTAHWYTQMTSSAVHV